METNWEDLSAWGKFTDKDPRRPAKTWSNRFFWFWPIRIMKGGKVRSDTPRVKISRNDPEVHINNCPYIQIRTTRFKGETSKNIPLSNNVRIYWYGWLWGWD